MDNNWSLASYDDTDLQEPSNAIWTDEHHEPVVQVFDADRVVEGATNVEVRDSVPPRTVCDRWFARHVRKLTCRCDTAKLACCR